METYVIHVTKECNCDCTYCYEQDKVSKYTWEEVRELIDNIVKYRTSDEFVVEFLGGEPLMAWDLIKKSYEYLEYNDSVNVASYALTTNGTIMSEEIADYISKNEKMNFAVSMDGNEWSNQLRIFKGNRKNTYTKVMENIEFLRGYGVETSIHIVTHLYNVASIVESVDHLYKKGIRFIDLGTVESVMTIDEEYCRMFVSELDEVSRRMVEGMYPDLGIGLFNSIKPKSDVRSYIIDEETGKTIGESYGRSGDDLTKSGEYKVNRCDSENVISNMIYDIRETVYYNHQKRLEELENDK